MDINDAIAVRLRITDSSGETRDCPVIASGILAHEDVPESQWSRNLPWRFLDIGDVIPPGLAETRQVALDVEERASGRCRRVVTQMLAGSRVTLAWDDVHGGPGTFEVILDISGPGGAAQVARIEADAGEVSLASHVRVRGDLIEDLLEG
jgi:hypothetical protein